jgi:hypothetical protein
MRTPSLCAAALVLFPMLPSAQLAPAQDKPSTASPTPLNFPAEYPQDDAGVLVENSGWVALSQESPSKIRTKRGLVGSVSYGIIPAAVITEYPGQHAELQIENRRPVFCVCNIRSLPGAPVLVRLHPKKDSRELDGGKLPVLGAKIGEAKQSDLVPIEVVQPENSYWLVRSRKELAAGEYAVMLGTQNFSIFAFTIANSPGGNQAQAPKKL